jgi:hypothetical protein
MFLAGTAQARKSTLLKRQREPRECRRLSCAVAARLHGDRAFPWLPERARSGPLTKVRSC